MVIFVGIVISPTQLFLLILFLPKKAKGGDCWSINIGIIHVKNKMHVASPSSCSASHVVTGDDTANCVTHLSLAGCVWPIDRTKSKVYLTLVGHHMRM